MATREAKAVQQNFDLLASTIQPTDIIPLGVKLLSKQVITLDVFESISNVMQDKPVRVSRMLLAVISHLSNRPDQFQAVVDVFTEGSYQLVAERITETYNNEMSVGVANPELPPAIERYASYLRASYQRFKFPVKNTWSVPPCQKVIKLAAVKTKEDQGTRTEFDPKKLSRFESVDEYVHNSSMTLFSLDNLLEPIDGSTPRSVIVQGAPGIGKSTFAWEFCRKWAEGKLYQEFSLLVLLRMREKRVREAKELKDFFYHLDKKLPESVADEVISQDGKGVIFLFEGLDELPSNFLSDESFLLEILQGILPQLTIVVTSRPWAVQQLVEKCNDQITRKVDILGFMKEDISEYVYHSFDKNEAERQHFMEYISTLPQLETIMYVPLNSAFVVQIYKELKQKATGSEVFPHTLTQLYTALIKRLIARYMRNMPEFANVKFVDLHKLPEPINSFFQQVCHLAFMSFTKFNIQVSFSDSEVAVVDSLGLMQSTADTSFDSENTTLHSFLHFTIQEFLAAYHLSTQPPEQQRLFFETHSRDPKFALLLAFLIGLESSVIRSLQSYSDTKIAPHFLHWLYESQSPHDVASFLGKGLVYFQTYSKLTPFDIYSLTYCMLYSNCKWNLIIDIEDLTAVYKPPESSAESFVGCVDELSLFNASTSALQKFFSLSRHLFQATHFLYFFNREGVQVEPDFYDSIASLLEGGIFPNLAEFQLLDAPKFSRIGCVIAALHSSCCHRLETLKTEKCLFTHSDMLRLCTYISSPKVVLSRLALVETDFQEDSLQYLISAIPLATSLTTLDLSYNKLEQSDIEMLSVALEEPTTKIKALRLRSCSIDAEKAEILAASLTENVCSLSFLSLADNNISTTGANAFAEMLKVNTTLKYLRLVEDESIKKEGAAQLITALYHNRTLEHLDLSESCEPVEYGSVMMKKTDRVTFFSCKLVV